MKKLGKTLASYSKFLVKKKEPKRIQKYASVLLPLFHYYNLKK